ncbi:MAG: glutamine synthetase family protein [Deltaproteobacteria bacterium]|nr:glutamine synthetase family protein [Deltaproteobacteria bacterium]
MHCQTCQTVEDVFKVVRDKEVSFIQIWFTDILGVMKSFAIRPSELEEAMTEGMGFDASSIEGFARIQESDMIAKPDPKTFQILPWRPDERPVARMFCDILQPDGTPYAGDPRYALKRVLAKAAEKGYTSFLGPELEYFYFADNTGTEILDEGGYFDSAPLDMANDLRRHTIFAMEKLGIRVEYSHHEVAASQHEIDMRYDEALAMADKVMTMKATVKSIAMINGVYATFMPKPIFGINGSGMHTHQSFFKGKKNAFHDASDKYNLSAEAKCYIAGLLKHAREITGICSQWVNSYKRLVPGYEAPVYVAWSRRNRSALVRVPMYKPGKEAATRCEYRAPDPACNPYLAFSAMITAGLKGIEKNYKLADPVEVDIYHLSPKEREKMGIQELPGSLYEAVLEVEKSAVVKEALGEHIFNKFVENKKIEWDAFRTHVSAYEIEKYLPIM